MSDGALVLAIAALRTARSILNAMFGWGPPPRTGEAEQEADWKTKHEVFARSYDEVLAALKHQDEKLNRTLTAIAFLTAAGVTLFTRASNRAMHFPESTVSIQGFFFIVFLVAVVLALGLALAAIGPSVPFKPLLSWDRAGGQPRPTRSPSLIFYASIAKNEDWADYIDDRPSHLRERLARNFHHEAQTISYRVNYKIARSRESGAFVQLTVLSLSLLGIFSTEHFSLGTRWWTAAGLLIALIGAPFLDLSHMQATKFTEEEPVSWLSYAALGATTALAATSLGFAPSRAEHWPALAYALTAVTTSRLAFVNRWIAGLMFATLILGGIATLGIVLAEA